MRRKLALGLVVSALLGGSLLVPAPAGGLGQNTFVGSVRAGGPFTGTPPSRDGALNVSVSCFAYSFCMGTVSATTTSPDGTKSWKLGGFFLGSWETCTDHVGQNRASLGGWYIGSPGGIGGVAVEMDGTSLWFREYSSLAGAHEFTATMASPAYINGHYCI